VGAARVLRRKLRTFEMVSRAPAACWSKEKRQKMSTNTDRALQGRHAHPYCDADEPVAANPTQEYLVPFWGDSFPTRTKRGQAANRFALSDCQSD
jgi:hypothetical protein